MMNYFSLKKSFRQLFPTSCLLLLFSICSYGQKATTTTDKDVVKKTRTISSSKKSISKVEKIKSQEDLIMEEVVSTFNQNNQQALNELKSQDIVKYTALMNSIQGIYDLEKEILVLSKTSSSPLLEKNEKVNSLKKELADVKNQYSLK